MTEHLTTEEIAAYRARTLPVCALFRVSEHASACERCGAQIYQPRRARLEATLARARLELSSTHLNYDEMAEYVAGRGSEDDPDRVKDHLGACGMCRKEVVSLAKLDGQTVSLPRRADQRRLTWFWTGSLGALACAVALIVILFTFPRHRSELAPAGADLSASRGSVAAPDASAIRDGDRRVSLSGGSLAGLEGLPQTLHDAVATELASGRLDTGASQFKPRRQGERGVLMGEGETPDRGGRLIRPVAEVVGEQNPVLAWAPQSGATYNVSVGDSDFNQVAHSGWIQESSWRVPVALERGKTYSWQVVFRKGGRDIAVPSPPEPAARFKVLPAAESAELDGLRARFGSSHLVMGTAQARYGMWDDATAHFEELRRENPDSPVVVQLLQDVGRRRRGTSVEGHAGALEDAKRPRRPQ